MLGREAAKKLYKMTKSYKNIFLTLKKKNVHGKNLNVTDIYINRVKTSCSVFLLKNIVGKALKLRFHC